MRGGSVKDLTGLELVRKGYKGRVKRGGETGKIVFKDEQKRKGKRKGGEHVCHLNPEGDGLGSGERRNCPGNLRSRWYSKGWGGWEETEGRMHKLMVWGDSKALERDIEP